MARRFFCNLAAVGLILFATLGVVSQEALWPRCIVIVAALVMAAVFLTPDPPPLEKGGE